MNRNKFLTVFVITTFVFASCKTTKETTVETHYLPEIEVKPAFEGYRASTTILTDL